MEKAEPSQCHGEGGECEPATVGNSMELPQNTTNTIAVYMIDPATPPAFSVFTNWEKNILATS